VNIESDVLARYVCRALQWSNAPASEMGAHGGLTEELLREKGFI